MSPDGGLFPGSLSLDLCHDMREWQWTWISREADPNSLRARLPLVAFSHVISSLPNLLLDKKFRLLFLFRSFSVYSY
jgi:hypothetical protein